jgi:hypothetical protein
MVGAYPQHPLPPSDSSRNEGESDPAETCHPVMARVTARGTARSTGQVASAVSLRQEGDFTLCLRGAQTCLSQLCLFTSEGLQLGYKVKCRCCSFLSWQLVTTKLVAHWALVTALLWLPTEEYPGLLRGTERWIPLPKGATCDGDLGWCPPRPLRKVFLNTDSSAPPSQGSGPGNSTSHSPHPFSLCFPS